MSETLQDRLRSFVSAYPRLRPDYITAMAEAADDIEALTVALTKAMSYVNHEPNCACMYDKSKLCDCFRHGLVPEWIEREASHDAE